MSSGASAKRQVSYIPILIGCVTLLALVAALLYLRQTGATENDARQASAEAKAYVNNLVLSDVGMKATENFMQQQVVEIEGKISNKGTRTLQSIDVYCLFYGADGHEIRRERVPIVRGKGKPLMPGETRDFRLPFDALSPEWNQAMPGLVVAQIEFTR